MSLALCHLLPGVVSPRSRLLCRTAGEPRCPSRRAPSTLTQNVGSGFCLMRLTIILCVSCGQNCALRSAGGHEWVLVHHDIPQECLNKVGRYDISLSLSALTYPLRASSALEVGTAGSLSAQHVALVSITICPPRRDISLGNGGSGLDRHSGQDKESDV